MYCENLITYDWESWNRIGIMLQIYSYVLLFGVCFEAITKFTINNFLAVRSESLDTVTVLLGYGDTDEAR